MCHPAFASVQTFRLPEGNYSSTARIYDASDSWAQTPGENFTVTAAALKPRQTQEDAVASTINDMASLSQSASLLTASDSIISTLLDDAPVLPVRRLLASTAAYRIRLKRLLLTKLWQGSVGAEVSAESAPRVLKSVDKASRVPKEMNPEGAAAMQALLVSGSANVLADQLRTGGLATILSLCDSTISAGDLTLGQSARSGLLMGVKDALQNAVNTFVRSMTSDEVPFVITLQNVGVVMMRQRPTAQQFTSPPFYGTKVTYTHGIVQQSTASRRQQAPGDGVGVYTIYVSQPYEPDLQASRNSNMLAVALVKGGVLPLPLPSPGVLNRPSACAQAGCVNMWLHIALPPDWDTSQRESWADKIAFLNRGLRCRFWGGLAWDANTCKLADVEYLPANTSALVLCRCDSDSSFVYVDWKQPPPPPVLDTQVTVAFGHACLVPGLAFLGTLCAVLVIAIPMAYVLLLPRFLLRGVRISFSVPWHACEDSDALRILLPRARAIEQKWAAKVRAPIKSMLADPLPAVSHAVITADFGVVAVGPNGASFWKSEEDAGELDDSDDDDEESQGQPLRYPSSHGVRMVADLTQNCSPGLGDAGGWADAHSTDKDAAGKDKMRKMLRKKDSARRMARYV
jgi:hypothetical protein